MPVDYVHSGPPTTHAVGGSAHSASTLAELNALVSDATLDDAGDSRPPDAHALGGAAHTAATLAELNALVSDATLDDSGDSRPPDTHAIGGSAHSASTLAALNALVSDATLDDSGDPRTPTAHASTHNDGGADEITAQLLGSGAATSGQIMETDGVGGWTLIATPSGGASDHGALTGLGDDDHPQYLLADGSRDLTGSLRMDSGSNAILYLDRGTQASHAAQLRLDTAGSTDWLFGSASGSDKFTIQRPGDPKFLLDTTGELTLYGNLRMDSSSYAVARLDRGSQASHGSQLRLLTAGTADWVIGTNPGSDSVDFNVGATTVAQFETSGKVTIDNGTGTSLNVGAGSSATPALELGSAGSGDGIYVTAGGVPAITSGGSIRASFSAGLRVYYNGTASNYSFNVNGRGGLYSPGADQIALAAGGSLGLVVDNSNNNLVFYVNGTEEGRFDSSTLTCKGGLTVEGDPGGNTTGQVTFTNHTEIEPSGSSSTLSGKLAATNGFGPSSTDVATWEKVYVDGILHWRALFPD